MCLCFSVEIDFIGISCLIIYHSLALGTSHTTRYLIICVVYGQLNEKQIVNDQNRSYYPSGRDVAHNLLKQYLVIEKNGLSWQIQNSYFCVRKKNS